MSKQQSIYVDPEEYFDTEYAGKYKGRRQHTKYKPLKKGHVNRYEPVRTSSSKYNGKGKLKYTWIALKIWDMFNDQIRIKNINRG